MDGQEGLDVVIVWFSREVLKGALQNVCQCVHGWVALGFHGGASLEQQGEAIAE